MLKLDNVRKTYKTGKVDVHALRGVDLEIRRNELIAIVGPSGSGKSTLMNIMGCLDVPSEGGFYLDGENVSELNHNRLAEIRNQKIGFVFQNFNLLPYATAFENVEVPLIFSGLSTKKMKNRIEELLTSVGLQDRMFHKPTELSGGEMQRVAIARALACNPSIILADEPTGNLDSESGKGIMDLLYKLWQEGHTLVLITHDKEISSRCKRIIKIRDGKIVEDIINHNEIAKV